MKKQHIFEFEGKEFTLKGLSVEDILKLLTVDFDKGVLTWLPRTPDMFETSNNPVKQCDWWNRSFANKACGCVADFNGKEYRRISLNKKSVNVSSVVLFLHLGYTIKGCVVDHKDGDGLNNSVSNLRYLSIKDNVRHRLSSKNKHGYMGVYKKGNKFIGKLHADGKTIRTQGYDTAEEAHFGYLELKRKHHNVSEL